MEFRLLGPVGAHDAGRPVALGGTKARAVLAMLLLHPNEEMSAERLAVAIWGEDVAEGATNRVQIHVSRLRKALGEADALETTPAGYRMRVGPDELDRGRFEHLLGDAQRSLAAGQAGEAAELLRAADALWRGPPLAE